MYHYITFVGVGGQSEHVVPYPGGNGHVVLDETWHVAREHGRIASDHVFIVYLHFVVLLYH